MPRDLDSQRRGAADVKTTDTGLAAFALSVTYVIYE